MLVDQDLLSSKSKKSIPEELNLDNFGFLAGFIIDNRFLISQLIFSSQIVFDVSQFFLLVLATVLSNLLPMDL